MLYFLDEVGSPLQPGIRLTITDTKGVAQIGYVVAGGGVPAVSMELGATYSAAFYGQRAPHDSLSFTYHSEGSLLADGGGILVDSDGGGILVDSDGGEFVEGYFSEGSLRADGGGILVDSDGGEFVEGYFGDADCVVVVPSFRSPYLSVNAAALLQADVFPLQRAGAVAPTTAAIQQGLAARNAALDVGLQQAHGAMRLYSSTGSAITTWATDFLGPGTWSQAPGESDSAYISRIVLWLQTDGTTWYGMQLLLQSWMDVWGLGIINPKTFPGLSYDNSGAFDDQLTAFDNPGQPAIAQAPQVLVFDWQSNPSLSLNVGLQRDQGQFCILLLYPGFAAFPQWFIGEKYIGVDTYLSSSSYYTVPPFTADFDRIVQTRKAQGTWPVYRSTQAPVGSA